MKRHEMNGQATICKRQKADGSRQLAVGCLLLVASCRASAPEAGRYQWNSVPHEGEQEKQDKEAREKRAALVKEYSQMPLEKQVAWAKDIKICKFMGMRSDHRALLPYFESYESLKGQYSSSGCRHPYKSTDDNLVVWFKAIVDGEDLSFSLSRTPIDSKGGFPAPVTISDDVKAEINRQAAKQEEAHAENH